MPKLKLTLHPEYPALDPEIVPLVRVITAIGLPPVYACAGHEERSRGILQYAYPMVCMLLEPNDVRQAKCFRRLAEMLDIFDSCCHSRYDVAWMLRLVENQQACHLWSLRPTDTGRPLRELHYGIRLLTDNLGLMDEWYTPIEDKD
ncbi:MAG: hypothetical protein WBO92_01600 [Candidatus Moraniibacteriota bacterium]